MPSRCILLLLDGLGDRAFPELDDKTPLAAAATPALDRLAALGANGLYHARRPGLAMPSESAHFAMFGYAPEEFPGRGPLEALGAGIELQPGEPAVLAHFVSVREQDGGLMLVRDVPEATDEEISALAEAVGEFQAGNTAVRFHRTKGVFGVLTLAGGRLDPRITDSSTMEEGRMLSEIHPLESAAWVPAAAATAQAVKAYLVQAFRTLSAHPINSARIERGEAPLNMMVTQRAGKLGKIPSMHDRYGLWGLSVSSGHMYAGLAELLGMNHIPAPSGNGPEQDYAEAIALGLEQSADHDFIHIHTKEPDKAGHTKDPIRKKNIIEALDRALDRHMDALIGNPDILLAVTGDHSTPSSGPLIHSGEPVPLCMVGQGQRVDGVTEFNEIAAANGSLGMLRGREFMWTVLNALDRIKLTGVNDSPAEQMYWPGEYEPFSPDDE